MVTVHVSAPDAEPFPAIHQRSDHFLSPVEDRAYKLPPGVAYGRRQLTGGITPAWLASPPGDENLDRIHPPGRSSLCGSLHSQTSLFAHCSGCHWISSDGSTAWEPYDLGREHADTASQTVAKLTRHAKRDDISKFNDIRLLTQGLALTPSQPGSIPARSGGLVPGDRGPSIQARRIHAHSIDGHGLSAVTKHRI